MEKIKVQELIELLKSGIYSEEELTELKIAIGGHLSYLSFCRNQKIEPYLKADDERNDNE